MCMYIDAQEKDREGIPGLLGERSELRVDGREGVSIHCGVSVPWKPLQGEFALCYVYCRYVLQACRLLFTIMSSQQQCKKCVSQNLFT